jgi:polysaccharide export outer membrane protein
MLKATAIIWLVLLALVSSANGQSPPAGKSSASAAMPAEVSHPNDVLVSSGDLLVVSVYGAPDYHYEVRVSSQGDASLPMVGNIKLAGLSTVQAENAIARSLKDQGFFTDPRVSVFVKEYATEGISIMGEVQHPGIYPLLGHRTLLDAISAAGGTTPKAGKSVTITHRDQPDSAETVKLSTAEGQTMSDVKIRPGDTVVVSTAGVVYVVGAVRDPMGIIMDNPHLSVLQAIAMAHGTNSTAAMGSAKLIRNVNGTRQQIPIPLDKMLEAKGSDLALQANDIVFVPTSKTKVLTQRGLEAVVQAGTGIAAYGRY